MKKENLSDAMLVTLHILAIIIGWVIGEIIYIRYLSPLLFN